MSDTTIVDGIYTNGNDKLPVPIKVEADGTVDVTGTFVPSGTQNVNVTGNTTDFSTHTAQVDGSQQTQVTNFPAIQPVSGTVTALQGTSPWVVSGTITTSPDVNIHDSAGNTLSSTGTSLDVNVTDFPATVAVTQSTSPWVVSGTVTANAGTGNFTVVQPSGASLHVDVDNFPATQPVSGTVTALQGTSPWVVSGTITTSPDVNVHDGTGVSISSTGSSLNVNVTNTVPVTGPLTDAQLRALPVPISGTVTANLGTVDGLALDATLTNSTQKTQIVQGGNTAVVDGTGDLQVDVNNFPSSQNVVVTNTPTVNQGTSPWVTSVSNFPATTAVTQSTSPWVVSGTVTSNPPTRFQTVLSNVTLTTSGSSAVTLDPDVYRDVVVVTRINGPVTGTTPTLVFTVNDLDQPTNNILSGTSSSTFTSATTDQAFLHFTRTGKLQLNWTITGTTPSFGGVYVTLISKQGSTLRNSSGTEIATSANPLRVDPTGTTTQPVSGTVTANIGTSGSLALNATLTNSTQTTQIVQGGNTAVVDGTGDLQVDVNNFPATQAVSGTVTANAGSGTFNIQANASVNVNQIGGTAVTTNIGNAGAGTQRVVLASDQPVLSTVATTPTIATYSASVNGLVTALLATDIFTITGSGTKTVKVYAIKMTFTRTGSTNSDFILVKRSTANSGGTSTTATNVPHDSNNAAGTATVLAYTANPTLGTLIGRVRDEKAFANVLGTGPSQPIEWKFGNGVDQPIVLRGTSQVLAVSFGGVTMTGSSVDIFIEWTEE